MKLVAVALTVAFVASVASAESMLEAFEEFRDKKANQHKLPDNVKGVVCEQSGENPKSLVCANKHGVRCSQDFLDELETCPQKRVSSCDGYPSGTWRKKGRRRLVAAMVDDGEDLVVLDDESMPPRKPIASAVQRRLLSRRHAVLSLAQGEENVWDVPDPRMAPRYNWPSRRQLILRRLIQRRAMSLLRRRLKKKKKKKKKSFPWELVNRPKSGVGLPLSSSSKKKKTPKPPKEDFIHTYLGGYKNKKQKKEVKKKYDKKMKKYTSKHHGSKDGRVWCNTFRGKNFETHTLHGPCTTKGDEAEKQCPQPCGCILDGQPKRETRSMMRTIRIEGHCGSPGVTETMKKVLDSWDVRRDAFEMFEQAALFDQAHFAVFDLFIQPKENEARYGLALGAARCHDKHVEIGYMYTGMWTVDTVNNYKCHWKGGCSKVGIPTESIEKARVALEYFAWKNLRIDKGFGGKPKTIKARNGDSWLDEKDDYGWDDLADPPEGWGEDSWGN